MIFRRKIFEVDAFDAECSTLTCQPPELERTGHLIPDAVASFESRGGTRHAIMCKKRRKNAGARGGRRGTTFPHGKLAAARLARRDVAADRDGERIARLLMGQAQQLRGAGGAAQ